MLTLAWDDSYRLVLLCIASINSVPELRDGERLIAAGMIELHETANLHGRSLELASLLDQGPVYDAHYLVLAEALECELWTADERFYVAASSVAQNVHWLGEFVVPEEQRYEEPCQES